MKIHVRLDPSIDAYIMETENIVLRTPEDVKEWRALLELEYAFKEKKPILIDIRGMDVSPSMREAYGKYAKEFGEAHSLGIIRYGDAVGITAAALRLAAIEHTYQSNIYADFEAAKEALAMMRAKRGK